MSLFYHEVGQAAATATATACTPCPLDAKTQYATAYTVADIAIAATARRHDLPMITVGVYELPKLASAVIAVGARVAWDDTAKQVARPGTGMVPIGIATVAAGHGVTTIRVRLDGVATAAA